MNECIKGLVDDPKTFDDIVQMYIDCEDISFATGEENNNPKVIIKLEPEVQKRINDYIEAERIKLIAEEKAEQEILRLFVEFKKADEFKDMFDTEEFKQDLALLSKEGLNGIEDDNSIKVIYEEALKAKQPQPTAFLMMMDFPEIASKA